MSLSGMGQFPSPRILTDQFGYRPNDEKVAVIRSPKKGKDAEEYFVPDKTYWVIDDTTDKRILKGHLTPFN